MSIRDRIRRAVRKSESCDSMSQADSNTITTTTTAHTSQSSEAGSNPGALQAFPTRSSQPRLGLVKTFTLGRDPDKEAKKEQKRRREWEKKQEKEERRQWENRRRLHPSERPLTVQNLRHQEMLSHFTMTFGASDQAMIARTSFQEGISPCCTRAPSLDLSAGLSSADSLSIARLAAEGPKGVA